MSTVSHSQYNFIHRLPYFGLVKIAFVYAIYKTGNKLCPFNHQALSFIPVALQTMKSITLKELMKFTIFNWVIPEKQNGFVKGISTFSNLFWNVSMVKHKYMSKKFQQILYTSISPTPLTKCREEDYFTDWDNLGLVTGCSSELGVFSVIALLNLQLGASHSIKSHWKWSSSRICAKFVTFCLIYIYVQYQ